MEKPTGYVKVTMKLGPERYVTADSFGEAASQIKCPRGHIIRFEWAPAPWGG